MKNLKKISVSLALLVSVFFLGNMVFASPLPQSPALFDSAMAYPQSNTDTTFTLAANQLNGGGSVSGYTCFTVDSGLPNNEYECGMVASTTVTSITRGIDPLTGTSSVPSLIFSHRRGADVRITTFPVLTILRNMANGQDTYDNIISYTSHPTFTASSSLVDKQYVDTIAIQGSPLATNIAFGISKLSVAAASSTQPIAVGTNDPRVPTQGENDALVGTFGTPSSTNKYVTDADTSAVASSSRVIRWSSGAYPAGNGSAITNISPSTPMLAAESITAGQAVSGYYFQSDGGVQFDNKVIVPATVVGTGGGSVVQSFTVATSTTNKAVVIFVSSFTGGGGVPTPTSVMYGASSATNIDSIAMNGGIEGVYSYVLFNPPTGANNITVTLPGSSSNRSVIVSAYSYYNVLQSGVDSHAATGTHGASSVSQVVSIVNNGALALSAFQSTGGTCSVPAGIVNANNNNQTDTTDPAQCFLSGDSGLIYPAGSTTFSASSHASGLLTLTLAPVTPVSTGYVVRASSSNVTNTANLDKYKAFLGFAANSAATSSTVNVQTLNIATGLSGLTPNVQYYLNNTPGTIGTTAGTNTRKVGISTASTTLLITNIW